MKKIDVERKIGDRRADRNKGDRRREERRGIEEEKIWGG